MTTDDKATTLTLNIYDKTAGETVYTAWALSKRDLRKQLIFKRSYTTILFSDI